MNSTTTGQVASQLTDNLSLYFTDNIGIVISFVVGFMVLALLYRLVYKGFTVDGISTPQAGDYKREYFAPPVFNDDMDREAYSKGRQIFKKEGLMYNHPLD